MIVNDSVNISDENGVDSVNADNNYGDEDDDVDCDMT